MGSPTVHAWLQLWSELGQSIATGISLQGYWLRSALQAGLWSFLVSVSELRPFFFLNIVCASVRVLLFHLHLLLACLVLFCCFICLCLHGLFYCCFSVSLSSFVYFCCFSFTLSHLNLIVLLLLHFLPLTLVCVLWFCCCYLFFSSSTSYIYIYLFCPSVSVLSCLFVHVLTTWTLMPDCVFRFVSLNTEHIWKLLRLKLNCQLDGFVSRSFPSYGCCFQSVSFNIWR